MKRVLLAALAALLLAAPAQASDRIVMMGSASSSTGSVATDAIFDAAGDLVQGTGANTGARLAIGAANKVLKSSGTAAAWSTETYAAPGATGAVLCSDGTNWARCVSLDLSSIDMGGGVLEIPNGTGGTTDAAGEIYLDTNGDGGTNFSGDAIQVFNGTANKYLMPIPLPLAASQDNFIIKYDATTKTLGWEADSTGIGGDQLRDIVATAPLLVNATTNVDDALPGADGDVTFSLAANPTFVGPKVGNGATGPGFVEFLEDSDNGTDYVRLTGKADSGTSGSITLSSSVLNSEDLTVELGANNNTVTISSSTGATTMASALGFASTGIVSGKVGVITKAADYTLGTDDADEAYGYLVTMTATGTVTLPAVAIGMSVCVYSTTAAAVIINPNDNDQITLNGVKDATPGDTITSASGAGDFICLVANDADGWLTMGRSGTWTAQ